MLGTRKGLAFGTAPTIAIAMGVITGVAGGILRDLLIGEIPLVFRPLIYLYATAAFFGLGAYASGTKREVSQKESAIILLAGPLPGIFVGLLIYFLHNSIGSDSIYYSIDLMRWASIFLIFLNVLNLLLQPCLAQAPAVESAALRAIQLSMMS